MTYSPKAFLHIITGFCILFLTSCISIGRQGDSPADLSRPTDNLRVIERGLVKYRMRPGSIFDRKQNLYIETHGIYNTIICDGTIQNPTFNGGTSNTIFGYKREYYWKGDIKSSETEENDVYIFFSLYSRNEDGGASFDKKIEFLTMIAKNRQFNKKKLTSTDDYMFILNSEAREELNLYFIPFTLAEYKTNAGDFTVYAVYADVWLNANGEEDPQLKNKLLDYTKLISNSQKYQIVSDTGIVAAELLDGNYYIYDSLSADSLDKMRTCIGILYSVINISEEALSISGWL